MTRTAPLTEAEHVHRLRVVEQARRDGLTQTATAAQLGITRPALTAWADRHHVTLPQKGTGHGRPGLPLEEHLRRAEAVEAAPSMTAAARMLGIPSATLYHWYNRHGYLWLDDAPPPPGPVRKLAVYQATADGWRVDCWPCGRRFARPTHRRADRLAALHARMHRLSLTRRGPRGTRYETTATKETP